MLLLIKYTLLYGIVLMLVALGGMFSEHSGVINIALEGIMVVGGLAGVLVTASLPTTMAPALIVLAAVVAAAVCGMLYSLLLAFASINLKADQTIGGTALNMLATAIAMILAKNFNGSTSTKISYTNFRPRPGGGPQFLEQPDLQVFLSDYSHRRHPVYRGLYRHVQDPLWPAPARLRRAPPGSGFRWYQRLPHALCRCADLRFPGRCWRPGLRYPQRADLEL